MSGHTDRDRQILTMIVIIVSILVIGQTINNVVKIIKMQDQDRVIDSNKVEYLSVPKGIGSATFNTDIGTTNICINNAPLVTYECNLTEAVLNTSNVYNCTFNATDANNDAITFRSEWMTTPIMFNVTPSGYYNFSPKRAAMNQINVLRIYAYDDSNCTNNKSFREINMTVVGTNRAPYLSRTIPDEKVVKGAYILLNLNDYFTDPDEDMLAYFYVPLTGTTVKVKVIGHNAEIRALDCGVSTVYFTAVDPWGLSNISNIISYEVTCPEDEQESSGDTNGGSNPNSGDDTSWRNCMPDWRCGKWSECQPWNTTYKRCFDYNGCNKNHYEQYLFENCTYSPSLNYCKEKWECNPWSTCKNNLHSRTCIDLNTCGTNTTKPQESENCSKVSSCFNGIQDPEETGVDCGGPCGVCRNVEQPSQINNLSKVLIAVGALTFGTVGMLGYIFRAKIMTIYRKIFAKKPRKKHKIYINDKQKEKLVQLLNIIQVRLNEHKINHAIDESSVFIREYFKQLLSIDNLNQHELLTNIIKLKDKDLEKTLVMFYAKIINTIHLRNKGVEIRESEIQALIDEMSHEIFLLAEFTDAEAEYSVKIRAVEGKEPLDSIYNKLSNLYIALKFGEIIVAKSTYKSLLKEYESLSNKDKRIPYNDIIRAFHAINYLEIQYSK